jgi:hypothetical protein
MEFKDLIEINKKLKTTDIKGKRIYRSKRKNKRF